MDLHQYCKIWKFIFPILLIWFFSIFVNINTSESYYFWLKSANNTPENIEAIENKYDANLPIVSFIFDPREQSDVLNSIDRIVDKLWTDRIYHFTVSPDMYSATDVGLWKFDAQYTAFFKKIKEKNLHVIFRTMHEMNGGWYSRSSNPEKFKGARIHVWTLSRVAWLDEENIIFDFSINHRDMPTKWTPSQSAKLIECHLAKKDCYHFEDYYPWDEFVDVVWFTFYNRWKAIWNRKWLSPRQILYDKNRKTYERLKKLWKPIIIDEVATTSVRYDWDYNYSKSRNEYLNHDERKDYWLHQLRDFLIKNPEIIATLYFNTDYTHWLIFNVIWEADRAIVNIENDKIYWWFQELEMFGEKELDNILSTLFHQKRVRIDNQNVFISSQCTREITTISSLINSKAEKIGDKIALINKLKGIDFGSKCISKSLNTLLELYTKNNSEWDMSK